MRKILLSTICLFLMLPLLKSQTPVKKDTIIIGGAFRYTYMKNSWDKTHDKIGGRAIFDVFILNVKGSIKGIDFSMEDRYYAESSGGFMLRNAYVGLPLSDNLELKLGMPRTPFGIMPFTSNSFMFNMQYYLGLEDDADIGALLEYKKDRWEAQLNFAKNAEDIFSQGNNRYAYDISGDNQEVNQMTGRVAYHLGENRNIELGLSGQYGGIYNTKTEKTGKKWAYALHALIQKGRWDLKTEILAYQFSARDSIKRDYINLGAFAADYQVANKGLCYSACLGYKINVNHLLLNDIKFYNDFSALKKSKSGFASSLMNVTGCMIHTGPIYMLIDYVFGKNQPWIGTNYNKALSVGGDSGWNKRFNVNLGIYF